jgi:hypothetical protein
VKLTQKCNAAGRKCKLKGSLDVRNEGDLSAPASTVAYYLSDNATLDGSDTRLGENAVSGIDIDGTVRVAVKKVKTPAGASVSGRFVIAVVDDGDGVEELDETNNAIVFGPIP